MLLSTSLFTAASAQMAAHPADQRLRNAAAQVEVDCLIGVSTELVGHNQRKSASVDEHYRPSSRCDIDTIRAELQAIVPDCGRAVVPMGDWLHIGPGRATEHGCELIETMLDDAYLEVSPGMNDLNVAASTSTVAGFFIQRRLWTDVPDGGISLREMSRLGMMRGDGHRRYTVKVEHPPEGGKPWFTLTLVGGPYSGSIEVLEGRYSHSTKWWIPHDAPYRRELTQEEKLRIREANRRERLGEISFDESQAIWDEVWAGALINPAPPPPRPPDLAPGVPWPEEED